MKKTAQPPVTLLALVAMILIVTTSCKKTDEPEPVTDIDGNEYKTVVIGSQTWFMENLKTTRLNNGTAITNVTNLAEWSNLTAPGFCWYDNNESLYKDSYGALYNWYAVETGKLCPQGWHVPSDDEWQQLVMFLDPAAASGFGESAVAGGKLKEKGTAHWLTPNEGATNESGFSALPGGVRLNTHDFLDNGKFGFWWSGTEYSDPLSWNIDMGYNYAIFYRYKSYKTTGESVRCLKD